MHALVYETEEEGWIIEIGDDSALYYHVFAIPPAILAMATSEKDYSSPVCSFINACWERYILNRLENDG